MSVQDRRQQHHRTHNNFCVCYPPTPLRLAVGHNHMGVSENRGPFYSTLNSRTLDIRTPTISYPEFSESPILNMSTTLRLWAASVSRSSNQGPSILGGPETDLKKPNLTMPWVLRRELDLQITTTNRGSTVIVIWI